MKKENIVPIVIALIIVGLIALAWFLGNWYGKKMILDSYQNTTDTVIRYVTVHKEYPEPIKTVSNGFVAIPKYMFLTDTLEKQVLVEVPGTTDTVYLPREQKYYSEMEGKLRMWISGYDPRLDKWEFDAPTVTVTNTVYTKPSKWSFSISGGWGVTYDVFSRRLGSGPSIVIGGSYSF